MIALRNVEDRAIAIEPDLIESVEQDPGGDPNVCLVRTSSGKEHLIARSYAYVTGIVRKFYETY